MIKQFSIMMITLLVLSCGNSEVKYKKPDNLIPKEQMVDILYDMHLAVGASNQQNIHLEKNRNYVSLVFDKHGIDSTTFAISNIYYTAEIEEYEEIFEQVEARLKLEKEANDKVRDSLSEKFVPVGKMEETED